MSEQVSQIKSRLAGASFEDFKSYLMGLNIPGLAMGSLVGASLTDIVKAVGEGIIKPIVEAVLGLRGGGLKMPKFNLSSLFSKVIEFVLTMAAIYLLTTALNVELRKPVSHVYVTEDPGL